MTCTKSQRILPIITAFAEGKSIRFSYRILPVLRSFICCIPRHPEIRLLHHRQSNDLRGRAIRNQISVAQHDDAICELADHVHLVFDQKNGLRSIALQLENQIEDDRNLFGAHACGRLIEHIDARICRHQHADFELALVAVRQISRQGRMPVR